MNRWWIYQRERFPLAAYLSLAAATGLAACSYSALLRGQAAGPGATTLLAASASAFAFFVQMRVADEFKDRADDALWRPYRPVPRGLVRLRELAGIGIAAALIQLALAWTFGPAMLVPLLLLWGYFALTTAEFGLGRWLKERPLAYLASHLPVAGLIMLQASSFDWLDAGSTPPNGLSLLMACAMAVAMLLDLGRKLRAPGDEEAGVLTYSAAWGVKASAAAWLLALAMLVALAAWAASLAGLGVPYLGVGLALLAYAAAAAWRFTRNPGARRAAQLNRLSALAALLTYLGIGPLALFLHSPGSGS